MAKLLVNNPQGEQEVIEVGQGGGYFDESLVLWDERKHGELVIDPASIGGFEAQDVAEPVLNEDGSPVLDEQGQSVTKLVHKLVVNQGLLVAAQARKQAAEQAEAAQAAAKAQRLTRLKGPMNDVNTINEVKQLIQDLVAELKL
jgi:hypothetical protein